ncbi:MAG TPA: HEAT repeat domain-containing protein [Acidobacteriota bacterium]|nr:HEAT repeat domain-containing protein [Acidobacteriota bacterium]
MDDARQMNLSELESGKSRDCAVDRLMAEIFRALDQRRIPEELLLRLARSEPETLHYCIDRMSDPDMSREEGAALTRILQRTGWIQKLMDALFSVDRETAVRVAAVLQKAERGLDLKLAVHLQSENPGIVMRSLELIEVIGNSRRLVPVLFGLLAHEDPRIQSKAALVVEKMDHDFLYTRQLLRHSDGRVRANALQAIADRADPETVEFLRQGAADVDHRVRSLAAVGLCRIGDPLGWQILSTMIQDSRVAERRSAAWAMGRCGSKETLAGLETVARNDSDERVRALAERGIRSIRQRIAGQDTPPS